MLDVYPRAIPGKHGRWWAHCPTCRALLVQRIENRVQRGIFDCPTSSEHPRFTIDDVRKATSEAAAAHTLNSRLKFLEHPVEARDEAPCSKAADNELSTAIQELFLDAIIEYAQKHGLEHLGQPFLETVGLG